MEEIAISLPRPKVSIWDNYVPVVVRDRETTVYLTAGIAAPSEYNEMCAVLKAAHDGDTVIIEINNGGGSVDSAFMIIAAMKESKAHIVGKLSGMVASASTIITMHCDEIEVAPYTQFMIHNYFHGTEGTGNQVKEYVNFTDREFVNAVKEIYAGFITPAEMELVSTNDKELWYGADETMARWVNKIAYDMDVEVPDVEA